MKGHLHKLFFSLIFSAAFISESSFAQRRLVDSLLKVISIAKPDTNKSINLNGLCIAYRLLGNIDSMEYNANSDLLLSQKIKYNKGIALAYDCMRSVQYNRGKYDTALSYAQKSLNIFEHINDKKGISNGFSGIGLIYKEQGNFPMALSYYYKALKLNEEMSDENGIALNLSNIGLVYWSVNENEKALEYFFKGLKIKQDRKSVTANFYGNIGLVYEKMGRIELALINCKKALDIEQENQNNKGVALWLGDIGNLYKAQGEYSKSLECFEKALEINTSLDRKRGIALNMGNIGTLFALQKKFPEAEKKLLEAFALTNELGMDDASIEWSESLSDVYEKTGKYRLALDYHKKAVALKDTLFNLERDKQITRKEMNYEFEKKEATAKMVHDKELLLIDEDKKRQKIFLWLLACIAISVAIIALLVFRSLAITRKQKGVILEQMELVEIQKALVEEKQMEVIASIRYAMRIQQALLPTEKYIDKTMKRLKK